MDDEAERPVFPEKWPCNFRVYALDPEDVTSWKVALAWVSEGLLEWGHDTADPERILMDAMDQKRTEE